MSVKLVSGSVAAALFAAFACHATAWGPISRWEGIAAAAMVTPLAQPASFDAPNVVVISPRLVTAGQPDRGALASLASRGFTADIYLAPPSVSDAVHDEAGIVERQGITYVNIPINFQHPTEADFAAFSSAMQKFEGRKVLVHCQLNMRASSMVFLYRVIVGREDPEQAYAAVTRVWVPNRPWKAFIMRLLRKNNVAFEPY
jgi:protein tyrosine phosphatase (PTP) superfamily phosphohydrolase (DUF442 family)